MLKKQISHVDNYFYLTITLSRVYYMVYISNLVKIIKTDGLNNISSMISCVLLLK